MGLWGDKEPRHDDFPIYVGDVHTIYCNAVKF